MLFLLAEMKEVQMRNREARGEFCIRAIPGCSFVFLSKIMSGTCLITSHLKRSTSSGLSQNLVVSLVKRRGGRQVGWKPLLSSAPSFKALSRS